MHFLLQSNQFWLSDFLTDWLSIESKWRKRWQDEKYFEADPSEKKKFFVTVAYPYPNSPQHIGHGRTYTLADVTFTHDLCACVDTMYFSQWDFIIQELQFLEWQDGFKKMIKN